MSLGTLIADGTKSATTFPWVFLFPAGVLVLIVLCANLIGDGLRDALDPARSTLAEAGAQVSAARGHRPDASPSRPTPSGWPRCAGMNFHVESGEVVALVGESGAGKSASAMAVVGLLPEYAEVSGSVRLHGDELLGLSDQRMSRIRGKTIGTVFQDPMSALTPVYTVGDQIAEALEVHQRGLEQARPHARAPSNCSNWSASPSRNAAPGPSRTSCPAANGSAWSSPSPSPTIPTC